MRSFVRVRRRKLVFVERALSGWGSRQTGEQRIITLRSHFAVTNRNQQDAVIIVRVRVGLGFAFGRALRDCDFCDIGDERVGPLSRGVKIDPRTTALIQVH